MLSEDCNLSSALIQGITSNNNGGAYSLAFSTCIIVAVTTFFTSTITNNVSQIDKLWSIIPVVYTWYAVCDSRTFIMATLATLWGVRLTHNFYRRGGYTWPPWKGEEDYRWEYIRQGHFLKILANPIIWSLFNLTFISFYQSFLLLLIVAPSFICYTMATNPACVVVENVDAPPLTIIDIIATLLFLFFVVMEGIADNQQFAFQNEKHRQMTDAGLELKGEYKDGFCQSGLFAILRKPNYTAEQFIWIVFYIFSVSATGGEIFNWSLTGCVLLVILFQGSGAFTEKLTLMKYPRYKEYQKRVPLYVPNLLVVCQKKKNSLEGETQSLIST